MIDKNSINYFNAIFLNQGSLRLRLVNSKKFDTFKSVRDFTEQNKCDYIEEVLERRANKGKVTYDFGSEGG